MSQWKNWTAHEARSHVYVPQPTDDKYSHGVLGVIAGSDEYPGSAVLACGAALRAGIGMIRYFGTEKSQMLVLTAHPEVVTQSGKVQAWLIGSGLDPAQLDTTREKQIDDAISSLNEGTPVLLDAGALQFIRRLHTPTVITPHFRELARLMTHLGNGVTAEEIEKNPREWCIRAATELQVCVLLKGNTTFISAGEEFIEVSNSTPWLATAGSGDVLAGIIGALIATQARKALDQDELARIAATGVFIHSRAAYRASRGGPITASDILQEISPSVRELVSS